MTLQTLGPCPGRSWGQQPQQNGAVWWQYKAWVNVLVEAEVTSLGKMMLWWHYKPWACPSRSWGHQPRHIGAIGWHYNAWSHILIEMQQSIVVVKDLWLDAQGRTSPPCMSRCSSSPWLAQTGLIKLCCSLSGHISEELYQLCSWNYKPLQGTFPMSLCWYSYGSVYIGTSYIFTSILMIYDEPYQF